MFESTTTSSRTSAEKRIADFLGKELNSFDINFPMIPFSFVARFGSGVQGNMMDLIVGFLNRYASMYINGEVVPGDNMFQQCAMCYHMLASVSMAPAQEFPPENFGGGLDGQPIPL